jgi:hypothetical protein
MKALKILFITVALLMSFFPLTVFSVYLFTFDKQSTIEFLTKIPKENFWLVMIPGIIMCYACTCYLFWKLVDMSHMNHPKPLPKKEVFYLEDDNLGEKLSGLISVHPGPPETEIY